MKPLNQQQFAPHLEKAYEEPGTPGNRTHITYEETGHVPTSVVAKMPGVMGEVPGEHRNKKGQDWEDFKNDINTNGIKHGVFITVDPGQPPRLSEGNHRRDAAVELGHETVPVQIRYFGHAERERRVWQP